MANAVKGPSYHKWQRQQHQQQQQLVAEVGAWMAPSNCTSSSNMYKFGVDTI